ncbi:MAG: hypothetical protein KF705_14095 [Phycisphaeraceae bacterium]|nr:hypothetical protein [Phycisphaeraceae bacterium]
MNPYVGDVNAKRIVIRDTPDESYHTDYGWIFDDVSGRACRGFDASDRPIRAE